MELWYSHAQSPASPSESPDYGPWSPMEEDEVEVEEVDDATAQAADQQWDVWEGDGTLGHVLDYLTEVIGFMTIIIVVVVTIASLHNHVRTHLHHHHLHRRRHHIHHRH